MEDVIAGDFDNFPQQAVDVEAEKKKAKARQAEKAKSRAKRTAPSAKSKAAFEQFIEGDDGPRKAQMRRKIAKYYLKFPERLSGLKPPSKSALSKMSTTQLEDCLYGIEAELADSNAYPILATGYKGAAQLAEGMFPAQFHGLSKVVVMHESSVGEDGEDIGWKPIVEELAIKYGEWFSMGPEKRFILYTLQLLSAVSTANTMRPAMQKPVSDKGKEEYEDL